MILAITAATTVPVNAPRNTWPSVARPTGGDHDGEEVNTTHSTFSITCERQTSLAPCP